MISQKSNYLGLYKNDTKLSDQYNKYNNTEALALTNVDYLYIKYHKPINSIYIDIIQNTEGNTLKIEALIDGNWITLTTDQYLDDTENFLRSGFVFFDNELVTDGEYRLSFLNSCSIQLTGINLVFCDENDLKTEVNAISNFLPRGVQTPIKYLESATKYIVRKINNSGKYKYNGILVKDFNRFDFLDINEIREAATYYALYAMYIERSDEVDDIYMTKADRYLKKFQNSFKVFVGGSLTLDSDDDGIQSETENTNKKTTIKFIR